MNNLLEIRPSQEKPSQKKLIRALAPVTALALFCCSADLGMSLPENWVEETEHLEVPAADLSTLECLGHNGAVTVHGDSPDDVVRVLAFKRAGGSSEGDASAALHALKIAWQNRGGKLSVTSEWERTSLLRWEGQVSFDISLPARMSLLVRTQNGGVSVVGLDQSLEIETTNGDVRIDASAPSVVATTRNGSIP